MKKIYVLGLTAAATISLMAGSATAQTQWIEDTLSEQCSAASREAIAESVRGSIESSVARAEASIQAPASIADLSCMNDLMKANIDVFSSGWSGLGGFDIDGMINSVSGGLKSGMSVQTLSSGVERAICDFAAEQFAELTGGLTGSMDDIMSGVTGSMPNFSDGFGQINLGFNSGSGSSNNQNGVQADYTTVGVNGTQEESTASEVVAPVEVSEERREALDERTAVGYSNPASNVSPAEDAINDIWDSITDR